MGRSPSSTPAGTDALPIKRLLPLAALLLACSGPQDTQTEPPSESGQSCDWRLTDGPVVTHGGTTFPTDRESIQYVDVDGAGDLDAIIFLGACGNHGDCEYVVATACVGDRYHAAWGPEYAQFVTVESQPDRWGRLIVTQRIGEMGCDWPQNTR